MNSSTADFSGPRRKDRIMTSPIAATLVIPNDDTRLTKRYISFAAAIAGSQLFEYFDFYTIGFVVVLINTPWHLTFGEDATILLATGVGTIVGALLWGWIGDRFGRRVALISSIVVFSVATGISALTPTGWWLLLAAFRFFVGMGTGGTNAAGPPLLIECTPARHRTIMGGIATVSLVPIGGLVTSAIVALLGPALGFRGLLLVGLIPVLAAAWVFFVVPESPRWLASQGRTDEARANATKLFGPTGWTEIHPAEGLPKHKTYAAMRHYPRAIFTVMSLWLLVDIVFSGIGLWGPTLVSEVLHVSAAQAAQFFIGVTLAGFAGRIIVPLLAHTLGRRTAGMITGVGGGVLLGLAGVFHANMMGAASAFFLFLIAGYFFADGSFTNIVPLSGEIFPATLRVHAQGLGNAMGGVGKIIGPLALALFANSSNLVTPEATAAAVFPTFLFFGIAILLTAIVFRFIAPETNRRTLETISGETQVDDLKTREGQRV
jgi:putative MFS transporter